MTVCTSCGHESPEAFKFCPECGATAKAEAPHREQRKTVTVLFCDVTGSTELGESTDPEALRPLLARYFERMKGIVESHGGTVEKFIGDAVMAVFGVPQLHEDDALRACRAALEMRDALPELGVQARIGVNTGEVVTGTEERLVTGDAVNVAARLEQAAQAGEVLIGGPTLALVRHAVEAEPIEPLELKGKAEPVPAHRLLSAGRASGRSDETLFVGRERELEIVNDAWELARSDQRCQLITITGDAGVGKSRLAAELLAGIEARVVRGRCLSYGEGITYWPVVEVVKQLDGLPSDPAAAASIRSLLRETDEGTSAEEIAWAFRKLLEEQAPIAVLFEDIHWAEETFLDLVEHVALLSSGAPILLLCLARPELTERRPQWPVALRLEPLPEQEVDELIPATIGDELRERIVRTSGGNPLFVTEMVAIARESEGDVAVPPTLKALLAARLDQLERSERSVLERGAIEGELFHRGSVQALSDGGQVTPRLASLVRKELIRPEKPQLPAEDAFRFRHLLIRDAAYDALPKALRAELHQRFADWLEDRGADLVELDEILGYHLEQATRYMQELGRPDPRLAERAGDRLAAAGRRALWRGDYRAAASLLRRALELTRPIRLDIDLELDFAGTQKPKVAAEIATSAAERATATGDKTGEAVARISAAQYTTYFSAEPDVDGLERLARAALPMLEQAADHRGLARVWLALGSVASDRGRFGESAEAAEQSLTHSSIAGSPTGSHLGLLASALVQGPRPADEGLRALDAVMRESPRPWVLLARAWLMAMLGRFEEAWPIARDTSERWHELSERGGGEFVLASMATLAGDHHAAADYRRRHYEALDQEEDRAFLSTYAPELGRSLCALGRYDEAESLAQLGRELGDEQDFMTQTLWRQVQARVHAARGEHAEAEALAREAVAIVERTDGFNLQGDALCDLAEVLAAAGRTDGAASALEQALERYGRKKNLAMVAQVRPRLEALREESLSA